MYSLVLLALSLVTLGWYYLKRHYSYWERRGFPYDKDACIPLGCLASVWRMEKVIGIAIHDVYLRSKDRFLGTYLFFRPAVLVRDAELARQILTKDFASFHDRGVYVDEEKNPLFASIFALPGQSWRSMRNKLSPCFTSGKLRGMYRASEDIGIKMIAYLQRQLPEQGVQEVDLKAIMQTYAIDIIASVIFGQDVDSFKQPDNKFKKVVTGWKASDGVQTFFAIIIFLVPSIARFLAHFGCKNFMALAMLAIIKDTIEYREKNGIIRKDMLHLFMQLRNKGSIEADESKIWKSQTLNDGVLKRMSLEALTAQAFIFYVVGQETTASTAAFTIFELAQYPKHLKRLQNEIDLALYQNYGKITYDVLNKMEFLEQCLQETLRKYPGLPLLNRECTQDYTIPNTNHVINKGTPVMISLYGIHHDPKYFPEPEKYDPNRFAKGTKKYNPIAYMPFGEGPRICIAERMGRVNSKLAIVKILQNFNIEGLSQSECGFQTKGMYLLPKDGVKVRLSKRIPN